MSAQQQFRRKRLCALLGNAGAHEHDIIDEVFGYLDRNALFAANGKCARARIKAAKSMSSSCATG